MKWQEKSPGARHLWISQTLEYIIGFALASAAAQSGTPMVPAVFAGLVILNAASLKAPLSAFRLTNGRVHQMLGICLSLLAMVAAVVIDVDVSTRAMLIGLAGTQGFVSVRFGHGI
jgi:hypothetical protein